MRVYVAMAIGCLECGNEFRCLGVFTTRDAALEWRERLDPEALGTCSHAFVVFEAELTRKAAA